MSIFRPIRSSLLQMSALTTLTLGTDFDEHEVYFKDLFFPKLLRLCLYPLMVSEALYSLIRKNTHIRELLISAMYTDYPIPIEPLGHFPYLVSYHGCQVLVNAVLPGSRVSSIWMILDDETYTSQQLECLNNLTLRSMTLEASLWDNLAFCDVLYRASRNGTLISCTLRIFNNVDNAPATITVRSRLSTAIFFLKLAK